MKMLLSVILALALTSMANARPVVLEEVATLPPPDGWEGFGRYGVAIDGNTALVSGERFVEDPASASGFRHEGAAFLYRRSGTSWNYAGLLGPIAPITQWTEVGLAMQGGIAITHIDRTRIFERGESSWIEQPLASTSSLVTAMSYAPWASRASSRIAEMLAILMSGLTAGPAVSL